LPYSVFCTSPPPSAPSTLSLHDALPICFRRLLALLTDLSLFAALILALAPLLPASRDWLSVTALAGFVIVVSYYYYVGSWLLWRSEEHTSELQSHLNLVCRLLLEKKKHN